jgi:hypothetical protein
MKLFFAKFFVVFAIGCTGDKTVTITQDFVINPFWNKVDNYFEVYKMKLKDSSQSIDLKDPTESELYYGLIKDTSFSFVANVKYNGEDYSKREVYFNKNNGFVWRKPPNIDPQRSSTYETIGELQKNTWYLLAGLSQFKTLYYIYFDSSDSLHLFKVSTMTNY